MGIVHRNIHKRAKEQHFFPLKDSADWFSEGGRWHVGDVVLGLVRSSEFKSQSHMSFMPRESCITYLGSAFLCSTCLVKYWAVQSQCIKHSA